ncbi:ATPases with chaperone activity, ATP-binding subunit (plasmid) [Gordonia sp. KTR9]|nr:ATPases with chaperone activity, ATP-binding subunit [Gordonia sp. KTR9]
MVEADTPSRMIDSEAYPLLGKYTAALLPPVGRIIGRENERQQVLASLARPRLSNILLLAPAGSGKTVLVQDTMMHDPQRVYLEVDLARMNGGVGLADHMAAEIKALFDDAEAYARAESIELVLFIDEFHQIVQMSPAAVEALKPVLAASGARGLKIVAATTFEEWIEHIRPNKPLDERLQRVNLTPATRDMTIEILRSFAEEAGVLDQFERSDGLFGEIHDVTNRYIPSSVQPRKAIGILDGMIGWHRQTGEPMSMALMSKVLRQSTGVNLEFAIDGASIKAELDKKVFAQDLATTIVSDQLQLVVAGLHDRKRPKGRFLLTGSTGVGKTELTKQLVDLLFADDLNRLIRFDMSEFALDSSMDLFRSELTKKVVSMGDAVILLDEIEKASRMVLRLMLQVLDDGRLSDDSGRQVSFLDCYIVLTTNAGSEVFNTISDYAADDTGSGEGLKDYMKSIENSIRSANDFPPELLGRLDRIVPFQPLSDATKRKILQRGLDDLRDDVLNKHGVRLGIHPRVIEYLAIDVGEASADAGGARESMRALQGQIKVEVAKYINANPNDKILLLEIDGEMRAENLELRKSKARPRVRAERRHRLVG